MPEGWDHIFSTALYYSNIINIILLLSMGSCNFILCIYYIIYQLFFVRVRLPYYITI